MKIHDLISDDVGKLVVYVPFKGCEPTLHELGKVVRWNTEYIFVRFAIGRDAKACYPDNLRFLQGQ